MQHVLSKNKNTGNDQLTTIFMHAIHINLVHCFKYCYYIYMYNISFIYKTKAKITTEKAFLEHSTFSLFNWCLCTTNIPNILVIC